MKAQSTNQDFPTPVTENEINTKISARDIGDARLTSYFYTFEGRQGDVFINVEANNFNGDLDVFTLGNLRPLTKITLYAGDSSTETGRVIYLRKPEKLILRVQGRTPNDNPATLRIKFAGSFVALQKTETDEPKLPEVKVNENSEVRVNSVGTIIEARPKPTPAPRAKETAAKTDEKRQAEIENRKSDEEKPEVKSEVEENKKDAAEREKKAARVMVADEASKAVKTGETKASVTRRPAPRKNTKASPKAKPATEAGETERTADTKVVKDAPKKSTAKVEKPKETPAPNPLESVRLIVLLKDGSKIERPMSEISRVNVDNKGMLTIVAKDGQITRHSILDVAKMTIE